jgi:hypothetical protein
MAKNKTTETKNSVENYLKAISDDNKRKDCTKIIDLITTITGLEPKMWGASIVGFGSYHYKYESGREGDAPLVGFSSRANAIVLYLKSGLDENAELMQKFGKHKAGKGCIYIKTLSDIDTGILNKMVKNTIKHLKLQYSS